MVAAFAGTAVSILLAELAAGAPPELRFPRTIVFAVGILAFALPAALVIERYPRNAVGWILAWVALTSLIPDLAAGYGAFALYGPGLPGGELAAWLFSWTYALSVGTAGTLLFLFFPNGRLPSPRWRPVAWASAAAIAGFAVGYAVLPEPMPIFGLAKPVTVAGDAGRFIFSVSVAVLLVATMASAASLFVRARGATLLERQQLKWLAFAAMAVALTTAAVLTLGVPLVAAAEIVTYAILAVPVAIGVAVLRYRLYDVDRLIDQTVVYGTISLILSATYVVTVVALQEVLRPVTAGSDIAVASSTLVVVALFQPMRARVQDVVDRRFFRVHYDAVVAVDALTGRLRDEVDIDSVRRDLLDVVAATVRPAHAGVWLRSAVTISGRAAPTKSNA